MILEDIALSILSDLIYSTSKDVVLAIVNSAKAKQLETEKALSSCGYANAITLIGENVIASSDSASTEKLLPGSLEEILEKNDIPVDQAKSIIQDFSTNVFNAILSNGSVTNKLIAQYSGKGVKHRSLDDWNKLLFIQSQGRVDLSFFDITQGQEYRNEGKVEDILHYLKEQKTVQIRGQSLEETALIAGVIISTKLGINPKNILFFSSQESWESFQEPHTENRVLISMAPDTGIIAGDTCVFIASLQSPQGRYCVDLFPRLEKDMVNAIHRIHPDKNESLERDIHSVSGVWPELKRKWFPGNYGNGSWPAPDDSSIFPFLFCQSWTKDDEAIVAEAFGLSLSQFHRKAVSLSRKDDPFLRIKKNFSGQTIYSLSNFTDFYPYYADCITFDDLQCFLSFFDAVFLENGINVSSQLREGLCRTLVTFHLWPGNSWNLDGSAFQNRAVGFLDARLSQNNLFAYAKEMQILVEIIPEYFLDRVFQEGKGLLPFLAKEVKENSWEYAYRLAWMIEVTLFFRNCRNSALGALASLKKNIHLEPNAADPVIEALNHVFVPWCRNLNATTAEIEDLAKTLFDKDEELAWGILIKQSDILGQGNLFGSLQRPVNPRLVNSDSEFVPVSREDYLNLIYDYYGLCIDHAGLNFDRWCTLFDNCVFAYFDDDVFQRIQAAFKKSISQFSDACSILLRDKLVECISKNKRYFDSEWSMNKDQLKKCQNLLSFFDHRFDPSYDFSYLFTTSSVGQLTCLDPIPSDKYDFTDDNHKSDFERVLRDKLKDAQFVSSTISACLGLLKDTETIRQQTKGFSSDPYRLFGYLGVAYGCFCDEAIALSLMKGVESDQTAEGLYSYARLLLSTDKTVLEKLYSLAKKTGNDSDAVVVALCSLEPFDIRNAQSIFSKLTEKQKKDLSEHSLYLPLEKRDKENEMALFSFYQEYGNFSAALDLALSDEKSFPPSECYSLIDRLFKEGTINRSDIREITGRLRPKTDQELSNLSLEEIERLSSLEFLDVYDRKERVFPYFLWSHPGEFGKLLDGHYDKKTKFENQYEAFLSEKLSLSSLFYPAFLGPFVFAEKVEEIHDWFLKFQVSFSHERRDFSGEAFSYLLALSSDSSFAFPEIIMAYLDQYGDSEGLLDSFVSGVDRRFGMHTVDSGHSLQSISDSYKDASKKMEKAHPFISQAFSLLSTEFAEEAERERMEDDL